MRIRTALITGILLNLGLGGAVFAQYGPYRRQVTGQRYATTGNQRQAEQIVRQAYRDILGREPDPSGIQEYTSQMLYRGWSEADVRRALLNSPEYAQRGVARVGWGRNANGRNGGAYGAYGANGQAASIVRQAYQSVLGREPDAAGMRDYTTRIVRDGWTEPDVVRSLRSSPEYRSQRR